MAVECGDDVSRGAAAAIERLRRRVTATAPAARLTWASPDRLHLTVRFIGEVAAPAAEAIAAALRPAIPMVPFDVSMAGFGTFPGRGAPRVIWAGLTSGLQPLREVEAEVTARLRKTGVPPESRPYSPHLTLARVRDPAGLRAAALFEELPDQVLGTAHVDAITLFESRLSPKGATYVALQRTPLTGVP